MKRLLLGFGVAVAMLFAFSWPVAAQSVDDFTINSFDATYNLSRDQEGRSVLKTTENITATFPQIDQNHGLERALPDVYDGHTTHLVINSVTDQSGKDVLYDTYSSNDNTVLRIGEADTYVHGVKKYIITYTQHDVSRFFSNTNADEFYWDVNGTGWNQVIESLTARVVIDPALQSTVTGNNTCYQGGEGQSESCHVSGNATTGVEFAASRVLQPGENVTFAIGFHPNTFSAYQQTWQEKLFVVVFMIWIVLLIVGSIAAIIAVVWMSIYRSKIMRRAGGGQTIPTEYIPPKDMSVLGSAQVAKVYTLAITAQLLDFAVRHVVKIYQTKDKKLLQPAEYELEFIGDMTILRPEEKRLLTDLFGKEPAIGDRFATRKLRSDYTIALRFAKSKTWLQDLLRNEYGIFEKATFEAKRYTIVGTIFLIIGIVTFSPLMIVAAIVGYWNAATLWPETKKGANLHDYLEGLRRYITLAESDRIKLLQSPEGVEKAGNVTDKGQMIKLYERVLGYAVLFGVEKEWMKQLGTYYEESSSQPDWYAGNAAFNAIVFSSALSSFSDQTSSYSSPSSASSGGSGGGGFSGGGGGGGGGGGW